MLAAFRSKYYLKNMDQIFINGIILNVSEREPLNPGKRKMFGDSGLLSQGPLLLSVSIISEFEVDATGSSMLSWILAFPMSVQLHLTFPVSGILCTFRPTWVYFPCLMLQLWALEFNQVSFLGTWNVNERRYLPFWSYCSPLQLFFCINSHATWLPRWVSGNESPCQCGRPERCGFDPWVGKIPWSRKRQPAL